jgi:hypothetical protein
MTDHVYGFPCVTNHHDFSPDEESCTAAEIAAHKEACEQWDAGTYARDPSQFCQSFPNGTNPDAEGRVVLHVTRTPWGIGVNTVDWEDEDESEQPHD